MAHQDYVSRPQPSKKKKASNSVKNAPTPAKFSLSFKITALITLIGLGAFSYVLWTIKDTPPAPMPVQDDSRNNKKPQAELPSPPKEKWNYLQDLAEKEVEVGEYEVTEKGPYKMQCGSFRTRKQAEVLKANIAFSGLSAQISESKGKNGTYFKVFLGPYTKKREAEKHKHKLRSNNINYCQIWLWK